jgi:hypothetical protein
LCKCSFKYFADTLTPTTLNPPTLISEDKWQESIPNRFDSSFNESEQEQFQEEVSKTVSQIMKRAAHIAHEDTTSPQINSMSSTKVNSTESSSIQTTISETKNHNDIVQSRPLPSKQDDEKHTTLSKCIPLSEQLAQAKVKDLAAPMESNNIDGSLQLSEKDSPIQKKFSLFTSDRLKQSFTNTSSPNQLNQFKNDKTNIKQNPNEKLKNDISFIAHPTDKEINNPMSSSNKGS